MLIPIHYSKLRYLDSRGSKVFGLFRRARPRHRCGGFQNAVGAKFQIDFGLFGGKDTGIFGKVCQCVEDLATFPATHLTTRRAQDFGG